MPNMQNILLDVKNLSKIYETPSAVISGKKRIIPAVHHVGLQIYRGETLGLVGESGCGKSTLARLIALLEKPSAGSVYFEGKNIFDYAKSEKKKYRRRVQLVFQDPYSSLHARRTAAAIIEEPLIIHKIGDREERRRNVLELMEKVGLSRQQADRYPHEFSGGQRQRIGIARALILKPELIVADEPVSALDVSIQAQILNLFRNLKNDFGLTYLFISHDLHVVRYLSDRIAVMYRGRIVETGTSRDIYTAPLHPYTRLLISALAGADGERHRAIQQYRNEIQEEARDGCVFSPRCAHAQEECLRREPELEVYGGSRLCACHLAGRI